MKKYGGELVYRTDDDYGVIEVVDYKKIIRSLHFGNETQQSGMYLYNHVSLLHPYTQAMLSVTSLAEPKNVLLLGIGGGSIIKFLLHFFHHVVIDAVDIRPRVIEVAREYFDMPASSRLNIHIADFRDFLKTASIQEAGYDLILVDLFSADKNGNIIVEFNEELKSFKNLLTPEGMLVINVLAGSIDELSCLEILKTLFAGSLYGIPVDGANTIALAAMNPLKEFPSEMEFQYFETKYTLAARKYLQNMEKI